MRPTASPQTKRAIGAFSLVITLTTIAILGSSLYLQAKVRRQYAEAAEVPTTASDETDLSALATCREWTNAARHAPRERLLIDYDHLIMLQHKIEKMEKERPSPER